MILLFCGSSEQHAVDELLQQAVKGVDIDGQVLSYLELTQVRSYLCLVICKIYGGINCELIKCISNLFLHVSVT